jgi:hypothetical protein
MFDVPLAELLEAYIDREDVVIEFTTFAKQPPLILAAQLRQDDQVLSETFKTFVAPGRLALENPQLRWAIVSGEGTSWSIEITALKPALYVHLASDTLDFWASDNYFFSAGGTVNITLNFLEPVTAEDLNSGLQVRSLVDLLT